MKYVLCLLALCLNACKAPTSEKPVTDRYAHIEDAEARTLIKATIEEAGGIAQWEAIKRLQYKKDFNLLLESGEVEKSFRQVHDYQFDPMKIDIKSEENGQLVHTKLESGRYTRSVNDSLVNLSQEALAKAVNTSVYVVSMPFKLLDPGAVISHEGVDTLSDGRVVEIIRVAYDADQYENHSTSDVWKYYFDKKNARIVANWVQTGDHFSWIENLTFVQAGGILFNQKRKSYRVDSLGNKLFLRAEYLYDNYVVE